jgi:hypothetical protein
MARLLSAGIKPQEGLANVDVNADITADVDKAYWVDTSSGPVTITLPPSPTKGATMRIFDVANTFDTNNLTIATNGHRIMGGTDNLVVDTEGAAFDLLYYDVTAGWRLFTI